METRVLTFEHADGSLEHLTSQVPKDGGDPELLSWADHIWKRGADGRYRLASIWSPDRETFESVLYDQADLADLAVGIERRAVASARLSATEIATKIAEEVHGLDLSNTKSMQFGWWLACVKIVEAINSPAPRFATRKLGEINIPSNVDWQRIACAAFEAYNSVGEKAWMTFDGRPVPRWPALNDAVREKWIAAVKFIVGDEQRRRMEAVSECETAVRHSNQDRQALLAYRQQLAIAEREASDRANRIATVERALSDLLVLLGERKRPDDLVTLEGVIARAKEALR